MKYQIPISLSMSDIEAYASKHVNFGFNGLGKLVYQRTYSRLKNDDSYEKWNETVLRVVNGIIQVLEINSNIDISSLFTKDDLLTLYDIIFDMKMLPAGRGLWSLGSKIISDKRLYASLNNCTFVSTKDINIDLYKPFTFLMDMSMLGCGVGFDVRGQGKINIYEPQEPSNIHIIEDTREGWVKSLEIILESYFVKDKMITIFDYSKIRKKGEKLKVFGGLSSGPQPLIDLHNFIRERMKSEINKPITEMVIVDIMNNISKVVIAGASRRSSSISLGDYSDTFLNMKNYDMYPERISYGWASNNSVIGHQGMKYDNIAKRIQYNGEPGILWLDNVQKYGRFGDELEDRAIGINPCGEQPLESYEMCNLVEVFISKISTLDEFLKVSKYAYYYGKIVSLGLCHWKETSEVQKRNRRIGISLSGITQFLTEHDEETLIEWSSTCYNMLRDLDISFSTKLDIVPSIRLTTIKPSGTISLLAGATPGVHFPFAKYYIRRVRIEKDSPLVEASIKSGYKVEDDFYCKTASVISVPVHVNCDKSVKNTSIWEKLHLAEIMQKYWSDNSVSITVEFQQDEAHKIIDVLKYAECHLKSITLLPTSNSHYVQMPYEEISKERYNLMKMRISSFDYSLGNDGIEYELGCTGDSCSL